MPEPAEEHLIQCLGLKGTETSEHRLTQ
jgi:hypothetical protein